MREQVGLAGSKCSSMGRRGEPYTHLPPEPQSLLALEEKWAEAQQPGRLSSREHMAEGGGQGSSPGCGITSLNHPAG